MHILAVFFALVGAFGGGVWSDVWTDAFSIETIAIPAGIDPQIGGIDATPSGKLAVCFHRGEVMLYDPATGTFFNQTASGNFPNGRIEFCATGANSTNGTYEM